MFGGWAALQKNLNLYSCVIVTQFSLHLFCRSMHNTNPSLRSTHCSSTLASYTAQNESIHFQFLPISRINESAYGSMRPPRARALHPESNLMTGGVIWNIISPWISAESVTPSDTPTEHAVFVQENEWSAHLGFTKAFRKGSTHSGVGCKEQMVYSMIHDSPWL